MEHDKGEYHPGPDPVQHRHVVSGVEAEIEQASADQQHRHRYKENPVHQRDQRAQPGLSAAEQQPAQADLVELDAPRQAGAHHVDGITHSYRNQHDGTFKEIGSVAGMAFTRQGAIMAAMCISLGDFDNDGWLDLYISDFQRSSDHIWQNDGKGFFDEISDQTGLTRATHDVLSFGGGFFDYDNDGWLDLFIANGHVYPEVEQATPGIHYKQINSLFHNQHDGKFVEMSKSAGNGFQTPYVGRGVAFADFDNDGFVDVVVANNGDVPLLLHNSGGNGNHFLNFRLVGTKSNRDAMGARIRVVAGSISQIREVEGGGSYLSQSDLRANFGLGKAARAESVEITWPSGLKQVFRNVEADKLYVIKEGSERLELQQFARQPVASVKN